MASLGKKATTHQLTIFHDVLFPGHNHLPTTGADDPHFNYTLAGTRAIIKVLGYQYRLLVGG